MIDDAKIDPSLRSVSIESPQTLQTTFPFSNQMRVFPTITAVPKITSKSINTNDKLLMSHRIRSLETMVGMCLRSGRWANSSLLQQLGLDYTRHEQYPVV